jgi:hypothetical protein
MGDDSMKISGRLRWVVDSDREDLAQDKASDPADREDVPERETSLVAQRIMKNMALIRAYEGRRDG